MPKNPFDTDRELLAYLAGIMDGEGCFHIHSSYRSTNGHPIYNCRVQVTNTNFKMIEFFKVRFGGYISSVDHRCKSWNKRYKTRYDWHLTKAKDVVSFLETLTPFIQIRKDAAVNVLEFARFLVARQSYKRGAPFTKEQIAQAQEYKNVNVELNRKGNQLAIH